MEAARFCCRPIPHAPIGNGERRFRIQPSAKRTSPAKVNCGQSKFTKAIRLASDLSATVKPLQAPKSGAFFMHPPFHYAGSLECQRISDTLFGLQNPRMAPPKNVAVETSKMAGRVFVPLAYAKAVTGQGNRQIRHASVLPRLRNYRIGQNIVSLKISFAVPRLSPLRVTV